MFDVGSEEYRSDIKLGERYREKTTGLEGVVIAIHFYEHACERVTLRTLNKNNEVQENGFDAPELVHIASETTPKVTKSGGPQRSVGGTRATGR